MTPRTVLKDKGIIAIPLIYVGQAETKRAIQDLCSRMQNAINAASSLSPEKLFSAFFLFGDMDDFFVAQRVAKRVQDGASVVDCIIRHFSNTFHATSRGVGPNGRPFEGRMLRRTRVEEHESSGR